jgi:hypothetical protein
LHDECEMLRVFEHLSMQCSQFLANTKQQRHPSHEVTSQLPGPQPNRKPTLQHAFGKVVEPYTTNDVILEMNYKKTIGLIHTNAVSNALTKRASNQVLGVPP